MAYVDGQMNVIVSTMSQADVVGAVLDAPVEGNYTLRQILKLMSSIQLGKTEVSYSGGTSTVSFRDINDTKTRVVAQTVGAKRTTMSKDAN